MGGMKVVGDIVIVVETCAEWWRDVFLRRGAARREDPIVVTWGGVSRCADVEGVEQRGMGVRSNGCPRIV